jgi:hypothetical protein
MEVLFAFLNWVSSFHTVDEETGNKMDIWNLATVITPNILRENNEAEEKVPDQSAIRVVYTLIECNESMCEVSRSKISLSLQTHLALVKHLPCIPLYYYCFKFVCVLCF